MGYYPGDPEKETLQQTIRDFDVVCGNIKKRKNIELTLTKDTQDLCYYTVGQTVFFETNRDLFFIIDSIEQTQDGNYLVCLHEATNDDILDFLTCNLIEDEK